MDEIAVVYHEEDGLWWAESGDVPGWAAGGDSLTQVRERVRDGLRFFLGRDDIAIDERLPTGWPRAHP
ncbi:MAG: DUF1902 domain-containing protein [Frankia sp.]|nr:DUF1902 domain-containing protein [Frankia sp.]